MFTIQVANQQTALPVHASRMRKAIAMILRDASIRQARISVAVVDDPTIQRLNRQFLAHDEPTDVLSFPLERADGRLEGEVVVSAERAQAVASEYGWPAVDELLLYVIHGTLHLVGDRDGTARQRARMRSRERAYLSRFGLKPPDKAPTKEVR